jgi:hypothetical protein
VYGGDRAGGDWGSGVQIMVTGAQGGVCSEQ